MFSSSVGPGFANTHSRWQNEETQQNNLSLRTREFTEWNMSTTFRLDLGIQFILVSPVQSRIYGFIPMSRQIRFGAPMLRVLSSHKNTFPTMRTNILLFQQWKQDSHQRATNRKERDREINMCRLVIRVSGLWHNRIICLYAPENLPTEICRQLSCQQLSA